MYCAPDHPCIVHRIIHVLCTGSSMYCAPDHPCIVHRIIHVLCTRSSMYCTEIIMHCTPDHAEVATTRVPRRSAFGVLSHSLGASVSSCALSGLRFHLILSQAFGFTLYFLSQSSQYAYSSVSPRYIFFLQDGQMMALFFAGCLGAAAVTAAAPVAPSSAPP